MDYRQHWRRVAVIAAFAFVFAPRVCVAFPESSETDGEMPVDLNGVWLLVSQLEFARPSPVPTPEAPAVEATGDAAEAGAPAPEATPGPSATEVPPAGDVPGAEAPAGDGASEAGELPLTRHLTVVNLLKIRHLPKPEAQKVRDADARLEQAAIKKAEALIAAEKEKMIPLQTAEGQLEEAPAPKVLVPSVPERRQPKDGDDVEIYLLDVQLPKTTQDAIDKAQKAEKPWDPSDKDLALLKASWASLKPSTRDEFSKVEWKVVAADRYDDGLKTDPTTMNAKFSITATQNMIPKEGTPNQLILVYGARDVGTDLITGDHVRAMMAGAPFPIAIEMRGGFKMYKVAPLPKAESGTAAAKQKKPKE